MEPIDYCHEIERYLCRKNDGHLIRVVGPSFELVSKWAAAGVPLKVAFRGIDRYFDRYYAKGPRRRPVKIDFCEADVLDVFDEWRRAVGLPAAPGGSRGDAPAGDAVGEESRESASASQQGSDVTSGSRRESLPAHLGRVVMKLSNARASGAIGAAFDPIIDRISAELDTVRAHAGGVRGEGRRAVVDRLVELDRELGEAGRREIAAAALAECARQADEDLAAFRATMAADALARARDAALDRLVRDRLGLPVVAYQ